MPTYKYECDKCGHQFEKFQGMLEAPVKKCPKCKGKVSRLISSGAGVIFKGKGFYQTDYKKSPGTGEKKTDKNNPSSCGNSDCCGCA